MSNYYCLVAGLPDVAFDGSKSAYTVERFKEDIYPEVLQGNPAMDEWWMPRPYSPAMPNIAGHSEMYAVSTLDVKGTSEVDLSLEAEAEMELYIDGALCGKGKGELRASMKLSEGSHAVAVRLYDKASQCSFRAEVKGAKLSLPACTKNVKGDWLYLDSADDRAKMGFDEYLLYDGYEPGEKTGFVTINDQFVGNNWAQMVCFLVEMGFLSNPEEDFLLSTPVYQQWLAEAMAQGVYEIALDRGWVAE